METRRAGDGGAVASASGEFGAPRGARVSAVAAVLLLGGAALALAACARWLARREADSAFLAVQVAALVVLAVLAATGGAAGAFAFRQRRLTAEKLDAERERRRAREEVRATLYGIGDGVIATDRDGRVTRMNPAAEGLTGWSEEEARGRPLPDVLRLVAGPGRHALESPAESVLGDGGVSGPVSGAVLVSRAGAEVPIAASGAPIRDEAGAVVGAVLVCRDQTAERRAADALAASEAMFREVSTSISDVAYAYHEHPELGLRLEWLSGAVEAITGFAPGELLALGCWGGLVVPEDRALFDANVTSLVPGASGSCELRIRSRAGRLVWVGAYARCVAAADGARGVRLYGALVDISERRAAEALQAEQLSELRRWHEATLGRETRVLELKREVNDLLAQAGRSPRYPSASQPVEEASR